MCSPKLAPLPLFSFFIYSSFPFSFFSRSPFFIEHSDEVTMVRDDVYEGQLLFEMPLERKHVSLLFDRYRESEEAP